MEKVSPIVLEDKTTGEKYTLEFNRESVVFTNRLGFKPSEIEDNFEEMFPILWYGAFRMHHKSLSRTQTWDIFEKKMKGHISSAALSRLGELYSAPKNSMVVDDEDELKNADVTVTL